jgi:hypothetical protein
MVLWRSKLSYGRLEMNRESCHRNRPARLGLVEIHLGLFKRAA